MKAMIFAAGLGTRLKPLTETMPKALVPVGGKPLLQHTIEKLICSGFDEIIINVHHFAEQIVGFVESNDRFKIRIEFSDESDKLLDTGGGIKKASWFFDDDKPFLIHNVDILSNTDLNVLCKFHIKSKASATLLCSPRQTSRYLLFDNDNQLKGWTNEKTGQVKSPIPDFDSIQYRKLAFSGIHVFNPSLFSYMNELPDKFSIIDFYLSICAHEKIICYSAGNSEVIDVGKQGSITIANNFLLRLC